MITTYQIRNVLRVYGDQLKKRNRLLDENVTPAQQSVDYVDISIDARRRQMLGRISSNLISSLSPQEHEEKSVRERPGNRPFEVKQILE